MVHTLMCIWTRKCWLWHIRICVPNSVHYSTQRFLNRTSLQIATNRCISAGSKCRWTDVLVFGSAKSRDSNQSEMGWITRQSNCTPCICVNFNLGTLTFVHCTTSCAWCKRRISAIIANDNQFAIIDFESQIDSRCFVLNWLK